jgi:MutS domain V
LNQILELQVELEDYLTMSVEDFISNGFNIGPNMGGKFMLIVRSRSAIDQVGRYVSTDSMERNFPRLGANDNIMANQSTFLVELNETSLILKHCTHKSLILLDELGRGSSTMARRLHNRLRTSSPISNAALSSQHTTTASLTISLAMNESISVTWLVWWKTKTLEMSRRRMSRSCTNTRTAVAPNLSDSTRQSWLESILGLFDVHMR